LKSWGVLVRKCSAEVFPARMAQETPAELKPALLPAVEVVASLNARIRAFDAAIARIAAERHPVAIRMCAIAGVGTLTALAYILAVADARRFERSRDVGAYFGLTPRRGQSGASDPQLRITKAGNALARRLLVGAGRYILGPFGPDCDLRRFGARLAARGGKSARKRAVVAVARKLAVLLHRIWVTGEEYQLLHSQPALTASTVERAAAR
jgi:transposase